MAFFILTRFVLVKHSHVLVERPSQGTSSVASQLTTMSLDFMLLQSSLAVIGDAFPGAAFHY